MSDHYSDETTGVLTVVPEQPPKTMAEKLLAAFVEPDSQDDYEGRITYLQVRIRELEAEVEKQTRAAAWANDCLATLQAEKATP